MMLTYAAQMRGLLDDYDTPTGLIWEMWDIGRAGFILYEVTEDEEINDQAYRDIQGFVIGLGVGPVVQVLLTAFVIA